MAATIEGLDLGNYFAVRHEDFSRYVAAVKEEVRNEALHGIQEAALFATFTSPTGIVWIASLSPEGVARVRAESQTHVFNITAYKPGETDVRDISPKELIDRTTQRWLEGTLGAFLYYWLGPNNPRKSGA